jgi:hypothetical protein
MAARQFLFFQISIRASNEIVRLADRGCHDPLTHRRTPCPVGNPLHNIGMRYRVSYVDQRGSPHRKVQKMWMRVDQPGQYGRALSIQSLGFTGVGS